MSIGNRIYLPITICAVAGLAISVTAALGHSRIASVEFLAAIALAGGLFYSLRKRPEPIVGPEDQPKGSNRRVDRIFGWMIVVGVFLHILAQVIWTHQESKPLNAGFVIELFIDLILAFFLLRPKRRKDSR